MVTMSFASHIEKSPSGIPGFDLISAGGLPKGRTTLISGTAGSAKTVMACQYLAAGIQHYHENGVFITFEESPEDIRRNVLGFGWDIARWEAEGQWAFVDASPQPGVEVVVAGTYDLGAILARIAHAVKKVGASRVSLDSLGAIFAQFSEIAIVRSELIRIVYALKAMGVTTLMTAERTEEYGEIARFGIEEFVTDNVVTLRNVLEVTGRRRTIEILKFRGTYHQKGEYPFTILPGSGIEIMPLPAIELKQRSSIIRLTSGNGVLDDMCGGGIYRDSITLASGATGTGKTLMASEFIAGGMTNNERCILFAFKESREQLMRNAEGWGIDFRESERKGLLKVICAYPEVMGLEDHLVMMKKHIEDFKPTRVAVDSLSALERIATIKGFQEFILGLTAYVKQQEIAGLLTSTTPRLLGGTSISEAQISTIADSIILLCYVEMFGEIKRAITVLKMRGSRHDTNIREFTIDDHGMQIGRPFRNVNGILAGNPVYAGDREVER